jgi:HlyD family secretion protein
VTGGGRTSTGGWTRPAAAILLATLALVGCGRADSGQAGGDPEDRSAASRPGASLEATPVRSASVARKTIEVRVAATGRTEALRQDRVRAPFASRLVALHVTDGDHVSASEVVAEVVSKNSEAALRGARQMLEAARTEQDAADARRAVEVAEADLVHEPLRAPAEGVVLSHAAQTGDYLDEGEVLLTIAEAGAIYFDAQVPQADLSRVRPGQRARVDLPAAGPTPLPAVVHDRLPAASSANMSAPVRLDFEPARPDLATGLFGSAAIVVGEHAGATVVPAEAVLRDDVTGVSRLAVVDAGKAHWIEVRTGVRQEGWVEILPPPALPTGQEVITSGQVGLPEGAAVSVEK